MTALPQLLGGLAVLAALCPPSAAEALSYTDKLGRTVRIEVPVRRAAPLQLYDFLPALRCWERIVAISRAAHADPHMLAAKPDIASAIPAAGGGSDLNVEALLKVKPDLVITWTVQPDNVRFLEEKGLTVIAVNPADLAETLQLLEFQGRLYGREREAQRASQEMRRIIDLIASRTQDVAAREQQNVLFLSQTQNTVSGEAHLNHDLIVRIGARNAAGGMPQKVTAVPIETIVSWNPDVIFVWGFATFSAKDVLNNPQYRFVNAVRNGRVYKAPRWSTWSPNVAPIALWMAKKTYPQRFRDVDLDAATDRFSRSVFGFPMVQAERNDF